MDNRELRYDPNKASGLGERVAREIESNNAAACLGLTLNSLLNWRVDEMYKAHEHGPYTFTSDSGGARTWWGIGYQGGKKVYECLGIIEMSDQPDMVKINILTVYDRYGRRSATFWVTFADNTTAEYALVEEGSPQSDVVLAQILRSPQDVSAGDAPESDEITPILKHKRGKVLETDALNNAVARIDSLSRQAFNGRNN